MKENQEQEMLRKIWKKCVNYETVSYLICGILATAVDSVVYTVLRNVDVGVGVFRALSWLAAILFTHMVNKSIISRDYSMRPSYSARGVGIFIAARALSGVVTWVLTVVMTRLGGGRGFIYELFCKFMSSVINTALSYVSSKPWIFKKE